MFKKFVSEYFSFTRKERTGILVIVVMILFFIFLPFLYGYFITEKTTDHAAFEKAIATLELQQKDSSHPFTKLYAGDDNEQPYYRRPEKKFYTREPKGELFYFDPNSLPASGWKKLGIREKTISTIQNYITKGGKFYKPEDITKIWGLHDDEVQRLKPFIVIPQQIAIGNIEKKKNFESVLYKKKEFTNTPLDINTADTSAFIALPGIGSKLANRIIAFREKLGGFFTVEQVAETFTLPDSTFQKIKGHLIIRHNSIKQFNINTATVDVLKVHPYIRYNLAGAIIQYRTQHGNYAAVSDIKKIMMVTDNLYIKLAPYLSVQ